MNKGIFQLGRDNNNPKKSFRQFLPLPILLTPGDFG
jgi:hypothetical protein